MRIFSGILLVFLMAAGSLTAIAEPSKNAYRHANENASFKDGGGNKKGDYLIHDLKKSFDDDKDKKKDDDKKKDNGKIEKYKK